MSQIHNDSDALRTFAAQVTSFGSKVDEQLSRLSAAMSRLGDTWEDDGYSDFNAEFSRTQQRVKKFIEDTEKLTLKLKQRADAVDDYARVRLSR